ncbi:MAG: type II CAAX endopeptidase family protein [Fimbriimonadaceae bacterium]
MSEAPTFEFAQEPGPPPTKRLWAGWICLGLLLALLITSSVSSYFGRPKKPEGFSEIDSQFAAQVGATKSGAWPAEKPNQSESELSSLRKRGAEGSAYAAAFTDLTGQPPNKADLDALRADPSPRLKAIATILESPKLESTTTSSLQKNLGDQKLDRYVHLRAQEKSGQTPSWNTFKRNSYGLFLAAGGLAICIIACPFIIGFFYYFKHPDLVPRGHFALPLTLWQADVFALRAAQLFLVILVMGIFVELSRPPAVIEGAWSIGGSIATIAITLTLLRSALLGVRTGILRRKDSPPSAVPIGIAIYMAGVPAILLVGLLGLKVFSFLPEPEHASAAELATSGPWGTAAIIVSAVIVAPIVEEIIFRGLILPAMHRLTGKAWIAIVVTNLLFASMHSTGIPAWGALAMIGVVCSLAVYQTGSLYPAMVMHGIHNGVLVTMLILSR